MRLREWPFVDAARIVATDVQVRGAYSQLTRVLSAATPPRQVKTKARSEFIYSQTVLAKLVRTELGSLGWTRGEVLATEAEVDGVRVPACRADLVRPPVHAILEFGNRASYGLNLVTRVPLAVARSSIRLSVMITPTERFGRQLDTNLAIFERVAGEIHRLLDARPEALPGPLMVVGIEPDR
jgi:hypothetical protein